MRVAREAQKRPERWSHIAETNFIAEIRDMAEFYESRIRLPWQDQLQQLVDLIEEEQNEPF